MYNAMLVGLGGFIGSVGRYLIYLFVGTFLNSYFPISTLLVNVLGCFAIGVLSTMTAHHMASLNPRTLLLISTGIIGGFTTFSAFALETVELSRLQPGFAMLNILGKLIAGFGAVVVGQRLTTIAIDLL